MPDAHLEAYLNFLLEVLQATYDSGADKRVVYSLVRANLDKLDDTLIQVLQIWARDTLPQAEPNEVEPIVRTIHNFSVLIQKFPLGSKAVNQEMAIAGYEIALTVWIREAFPDNWAMTQNNLGIAYCDRIRGERADNLEVAIASYNAALEVYTCEAFPEQWARIQSNLGEAYCNRIRGERADNLERAITSYNAILEVHTREAFPQDWAGSQNNLGNAYLYRIREERADNLEVAITSYNAALEVYSREAFPQDWAGSQNNLGIAYFYRIRGERADNLEVAITSYNAALEVYSREAFPQDWARTQTNLGLAYCNRIRGERADNLEVAIASYNASLEVYSREAFPQDWAGSQNNLGIAYCNRIRGERADNLEEAIASYNAALEVYTCEAFPEQWASTQNNLGNAYRDLGQIPEAFECFRLALEIGTPTAFPLDCLVSGRNLGDTAFQAEHWSDAIAGYDAAIRAVEQSCEWASSETTRQQLRQDAIDVYTKIVPACVNNNQIENAIEYIERSKARTLVELLANRNLLPKGDVPPELLNHLQQLKRELPAKRQLLETATRNSTNSTSPLETTQTLNSDTAQSLRQEVSELQSQLQQILEQIQRIDPSYQLTQIVRPISYTEIRDLLDNHTAILLWYITFQRFFTFVITRQSPPYVWQSSADDLAALEQWQKDYLNDYNTSKHEKNLQWQTQLPSRLEQLSAILHLDEILTHVPKECEKLILIPHRYLHLFPLHALPLVGQASRLSLESSHLACTTNGYYLLDNFPQGIRYAPSCQLLQLSQKVGTQHTLPLRHLFAIQNPTQDLDFTDIEVEAIQHHFHPRQILAKEKAVKDALNQSPNSDALRLAECLHFSCHGSFHAPNPLLSHLLLADSLIASDSPSKRTPEHSTRYLPWRDGKDVDLTKCLTLGEIFALDLNQCRLVTLSACETGLTDWSQLTDEYIGLASGFMVAGSPNVVSSLWVVNDLSTCFLMIKFYQNLQTGVSIAQALNQAQCWLRDVTKAELQKWTKQLRLSANHQLSVDSLWFSEWFSQMEETCKPFNSPEYWAAFCTVGQ